MVIEVKRKGVVIIFQEDNTFLNELSSNGLIKYSGNILVIANGVRCVLNRGMIKYSSLEPRMHDSFNSGIKGGIWDKCNSCFSVKNISWVSIHFLFLSVLDCH